MAELEKLYHRYKTEIWRYLISLARDPDEAEDLMQSVFIKLIPRLREGGLKADEARAYLYRAAHNAYVDSYRRRGSEGRAIERIKQEVKEAVAPADGGSEIYRIVDEVLASGRLSERQAIVLKLRVLGQYNLQEIADSAEITLSTTHRDLQAGLAELRRALKAEGIEPEDYESQ